MCELKHRGARKSSCNRTLPLTIGTAHIAAQVLEQWLELELPRIFNSDMLAAAYRWETDRFGFPVRLLKYLLYCTEDESVLPKVPRWHSQPSPLQSLGVWFGQAYGLLHTQWPCLLQVRELLAHRSALGQQMTTGQHRRGCGVPRTQARQGDALQNVTACLRQSCCIGSQESLS